MSSQATTDGLMTLTVTFRLGTDPDKAQQLVQNRVSQAEPRLPEDVRRLGVTTVKSSPDLTMVVHLLSPNDRYDMTYLRNYAVLNVKDRLARIDGVGQVQLFGSGDYSMRVWLDPQKVARARAFGERRGQRDPRAERAGRRRRGRRLARRCTGVDLQLSVNAQGRLQTRRGVRRHRREDRRRRRGHAAARRRAHRARRVRIRAALAARQQAGGRDADLQAPGSNAIQISDNVRATMAEIKKSMPEGVDYQIVYDPTQFVRASIEAVVHTLLEAVALVVLVVILFLQTWRASIIPLLAVPVSIIGTFAVLHLFGFSINTLTLFGLVLAIGIVVDDAIVVVENVERNIEAGLSPRDATYQAMREVSGPIIAIALVLVAVFVPLAFISGLTGQFYRQFALTIAISTVISAFNSLTLSPALAALLLQGPRRAEGQAHAGAWTSRSAGSSARFNRALRARHPTPTAAASKRVISRQGRDAWRVYLVLVGVTVGLFKAVPGGFVPAQDKQYLIGFAQLPDGATLDRTEDVIRRMGEIALEAARRRRLRWPSPACRSTASPTAPTPASCSSTLKPFDERKRPRRSAARAIAAQLNQKFAAIQDAFIAMFPPPPVQGLGTTGGFKLQIEDRAVAGLRGARTQRPRPSSPRPTQAPELAGLFSSYQVNVPQLYADIDRTKARQLGVPVTDVFDTMQIYLGASTSTTSTASAGPTRCACRPTRRSARAPRTSAQLKVRSASRRDGAAVGAAEREAELRARARDALQRLPGRRHQRRPGTGLLVGPGAGRRRAHRRRDAAARHRLRVDRADLPGDPRRQFRRSGCSRSRSCSCSWCSPRCTRA